MAHGARCVRITPFCLCVLCSRTAPAAIRRSVTASLHHRSYSREVHFSFSFQSLIKVHTSHDQSRLTRVPSSFNSKMHRNYSWPTWCLFLLLLLFWQSSRNSRNFSNPLNEACTMLRFSSTGSTTITGRQTNRRLL